MIQTYQRLIGDGSSPMAANYMVDLAALNESQGRIDEAVKLYQAIIPKLAADQQGSVYKRIGTLQIRENKSDEAIQSFEAAAKANPKDAQVFSRPGRVVSGQRGSGQSDQEYGPRREAHPAKRPGPAAACRFVPAGRRSRQGGDELEKLLLDDPDDVDSRIELIQLLEDLNQKEKLRVQYEAAPPLSARRHEPLVQPGRHEVRNRSIRTRGELFNRLVKLNPDDRSAHQFLFDIFIKTNQAPKALAEARTLIRLNPDELGPYDYIIGYYQDKKDANGLLTTLYDFTARHPKISGSGNFWPMPRFPRNVPAKPSEP